MSTYTSTFAYARAQAVEEQIDVLFREAGVDAGSRAKICLAVKNRWVTAVGLFLAKPAGRVYEIEARINWRAHSDLADLQFSTDLPGWEKNGSPEVLILGRRFAATATSTGLDVHYWGMVAADISHDPAEYRRVCEASGLAPGSSVPDWSGAPRTTSVSLQDIGEIAASVRSTL